MKRLLRFLRRISREQQAAGQLFSPRLIDLLIVGLSALAPALSGAVEFPHQVPLLCGAVALMALDARNSAVRLPRGVIALAVLLALLCASALLPAAWLGGAPVREHLQEILDLELPGTVALQPWMTVESLLLLVVSLVWGHFLLTRSWTLRRAQLISVFCALICVLAVASLIFFARGVRPPFWPAGAAFGPCPNRNETGFLFGIGGLLCFCLAFRKSTPRPKRLAVGLGAFLLLGVALVCNLSRSGILILIGGPLLWVLACVATGEARVRHAWKVALTLGLAGVLFVIFGGRTLQRFGEVPETIAGDYRVLIQKDALQLAHGASFVGVGAGNFEAVFPFYRVASFNEKRALHPESDWAALAAELGWLGVPLAWALLFWAVWRTTRVENQDERRLMLGAGVAAVCLWLHGFVDMNAHRLGAVFPVLLLLGIGQPRPAHEAPKSPRNLASRIALGALGVLVLLAWLGPRCHLPIPGTMQRRELDRAFTAAANARDYAAAEKSCAAALAIHPLDWRLYFQRAWTTLATRGDVNAATADFSRARLLEPNLPELPILEFQQWWNFGRPEQTTLALDECFRRGGRTEAMFDHLFPLCKSDPGLVRALLVPASRAPATQLRFLRDTPPEWFNEMLPLVLQTALTDWSPEQRRVLFRLWSGHDEAPPLENYLQSHSEQMPVAWPALARVKIRRAESEAACALIARWTAPPKLPELVTTENDAVLRQKLARNPANFGAALTLAQRRRETRDLSAAIELLAPCAARANAPVYFHFLLHELHAAEHHWPEAAGAWLRYDEAMLRISAQ